VIVIRSLTRISWSHGTSTAELVKVCGEGLHEIPKLRFRYGKAGNRLHLNELKLTSLSLNLLGCAHQHRRACLPEGHEHRLKVLIELTDKRVRKEDRYVLNPCPEKRDLHSVRLVRSSHERGEAYGRAVRTCVLVTSQGSAHGRFTRAIKQRNLWAAESSLRELGTPSLEDVLGYLDLLAETSSAKLERACVRWHGRLETEATFLSLAESQLALAALASLCAGERDAVEVLRRLLRRVRPTVVPRVG
jgi:hypothetical protein